MLDMRVTLMMCVICLFTGAFAGKSYTDNTWQAKWNEAEKTAAQNQLKAVNDAVVTHNKRIVELEKVRDEFKTKLAQAELDNHTAVTDGNGLSESFTNSLRESNTCYKPTPSVRERAAEATNRTVQAYVFSSLVKEAVGYAAIAEEAIVRGEACQAEYRAVRF